MFNANNLSTKFCLLSSFLWQADSFFFLALFLFFVEKLRPLLFFLVGFGCWNGGATPPRGLPQFFGAGLLFSNRNFLDLVSVFVEAFVLMVVRFRCLPGPCRSRISTSISVTESDVLLVGYIANVWFPCRHCGDLDVFFGLHNGMHAVWPIAVTSHFLPKPSPSPPYTVTAASTGSS